MVWKGLRAFTRRVAAEAYWIRTNLSHRSNPSERLHHPVIPLPLRPRLHNQIFADNKYREQGESMATNKNLPFSHPLSLDTM